MKRIISKQAFAKACNTSKPTLYKWIANDKDGIRKYVTPDGIDAGIFDVEPWSSIGKYQPPVTAEPDELQTALDELKQQLADVTAERDKLAAEVETLNAHIALLEARIDFEVQTKEQLRQMAADFKQLADQAQQLHMAQLAALPAPKKRFGEKIRETLDNIFTRKPAKADQEQPEA